MRGRIGPIGLWASTHLWFLPAISAAAGLPWHAAGQPQETNPAETIPPVMRRADDRAEGEHRAPADAAATQDLAVPSGGDLIAEEARPELIDDVWIPARDPGVIQSLDVAEGDWVEADQIIAELDSELYAVEHKAALEKLALAELKASDEVDVLYSQKSQAVARATLARTENAIAQYPKAISQTDLDKQRLEEQRASLSIDKALFDKDVALKEASLNSHEALAAGIKLRHRTIKSPIKGLVVQKVHQPGEWVAAGGPLVRVIRLDKLRIWALIDYAQIDASFLGRTATFTTQLSGEVYQGPIKFISSEVTPETGFVTFFFEVDNPDLKLRPGEPGTARIPK